MLRLLINLDQSSERLKDMQILFSGLDLDFERVSAIYGRSLPEKELKELRNSYDPFFPRKLSMAEIGCFLSHRRAWEIIASSRERGGFVFEDDITISILGRDFLATDAWIPKYVDVLQLGGLRGEPLMVTTKKVNCLSDSFDLIRLTRTPVLGTQAYWISRPSAQKAIQFSKEMQGPVDHFLFDPRLDFCSSSKVWALNPSIVIESGQCKSIIGKARDKEDKVEIPYLNRIKIWWRKKYGKLLSKSVTQRFVDY